MYESYFGFSEKPFKITPDPRFFYASENHVKAMSYLNYGYERGDGFVVMIGDSGVGKTTVAYNFIHSLDRNTVVIQLNTASLSFYDITQVIALNCDLETEGLTKPEVLRQLEQYFSNIYQQDKRVLMIIDEAHHLLPEQLEELRMLSNFQVDGTQPVQTFLFGSAKLENLIRSPGMEQFRQRIIAFCKLHAFDLSDTHSYIEDRLTTSGWQGVPVLDSSVYPLILKKTSGVPRKINLLMDRVFLYSYLSELKVINRNVINDVLLDMRDEITLTSGNEVTTGIQDEEGKNIDSSAANKPESDAEMKSDSDLRMTTEASKIDNKNAYEDVVKPDPVPFEVVDESGSHFDGDDSVEGDLIKSQTNTDAMETDKHSTDVEAVLKTLDLVGDALDKIIMKKIATMQYFDKMIVKKRREASVLYKADKQEESILGDDKYRKV